MIIKMIKKKKISSFKNIIYLKTKHYKYKLKQRGRRETLLGGRSAQNNRRKVTSGIQ